MRKEFAKYLLERLSADTISMMIADLSIKEVEKEILLLCHIKYKGMRGWQKQCAYDLGVDIKTISRRYNKALEVSINPIISFISQRLRCPFK